MLTMRDIMSCTLCGGEEDLGEVEGLPYCLSCRTCPHGITTYPGHVHPCAQCINAFHSLNVFGWRVLIDMREYIGHLKAIFDDGGYLGYVITYNIKEEDTYRANRNVPPNYTFPRYILHKHTREEVFDSDEPGPSQTRKRKAKNVR